ncbi:hypothetical protein RAS12_07435 [Achromobacter seleniivolatilans]|uniref:Uncharacterized protein n=1 Tax=Achromobacter seleniivolatilans TaxID=3047478 RepID=A0ABY9M5C9_9BURK|nr:hypothetical protein [Achromobacter sp. R39]WMD22201.1 hypothetical protein RAS12_07435 [Achromobacter sp. R39]
MTSISLLTFLQTGAFGPYMPVASSTPEAVIAALGEPEEIYSPADLDRPYRADDPACFPLIITYGDAEFHFAAATALATVFVDSFSGRGGVACGGSLALMQADLLPVGMAMQQFLDTAPGYGIGIRSVRPHMPPFAFQVRTAGGVDIGFEHDDPDDSESVPRLTWFCWTPGADSSPAPA